MKVSIFVCFLEKQVFYPFIELFSRAFDLSNFPFVELKEIRLKSFLEIASK